MPERTRNPYVAKLLSLLAPGLGHLYAGRLVPALALSGGTMALGMLGTVAVVATPSLTRVAVVVAGLGWAVLWLGAAVDAFRAASRGAGSHEQAPLYLYAVIAFLSLTSATTWTLAVRERVVEVFHVPTASMEPAIAAGSHLLVDKVAYRTGPVRRGDIVVFINPDARYQTFVKRVVALPGDTVEVRDDAVLVNGASLAGGPVAEPAGGGRGGDGERQQAKVPTGHCFVLGDNLRHSIDSRDVGPVPLRDIVGRVDRWW